MSVRWLVTSEPCKTAEPIERQVGGLRKHVLDGETDPIPLREGEKGHF